MIEAIRKMGEYAVEDELNPDVFLDGICRRLNDKITRTKKNGEKEEITRHVVFLNFNTGAKKIEIDSEPVNCENANGDSGKAYLWIGDTIRHKLYCPITTQRIDRLLTNTLSGIADRTQGEIKTKIRGILNDFFYEEGNGKETKYYTKSEKFDFFEKKVRGIVNRAETIKKSLDSKDIEKRALDEKVNQLERLWKDATGKILKLENKGNQDLIKQEVKEKCNFLSENTTGKLNEKYKTITNLIVDIISSTGFRYEYKNNKPASRSPEISIYTVKINDQPVCQTKEYREKYRAMIFNEKIDSLFNKPSKFYQNKAPCSICCESKETTSDSTSLGFKFYMRDKIGFSSNLDGKFTKNYNICKDCYQYLMIGENFIDENLKSRIGDLDVYIIPHFILNIDNLDMKKFSQYIELSTNSIANLKYLKKFQDKLSKQFRKYESSKNNFIINYLFYQPSAKGDFKILKLIKDIPPRRLGVIRRKEEEISKLVDDKYGGNRNLKIDLNSIWRCVPIKTDKKANKKLGYSRYLDIIDSIFSDKKIKYDFLIEQFTETIRIIKFKRVGYNIKGFKGGKSVELNNKALENTDILRLIQNKILQLNFLLLFIKKLDILGGLEMDNMSEVYENDLKEMLSKEIWEYLGDMEIYKDGRKKALFLLGYLIGEIGSAQRRSEHKKEPILDKINFQGMGTEKLGRLANEVVEKLRQNKSARGEILLNYNNKNIHSAFKMLFERNKEDWRLSNQENVFYVLSGYAFSNYLGWRGWQRYKEGIREMIQKKQEEINRAKEEGKAVGEQEELLKNAKKELGDNNIKKAETILKEIKIEKNMGEVKKNG